MKAIDVSGALGGGRYNYVLIYLIIILKKNHNHLVNMW